MYPVRKTIVIGLGGTGLDAVLYLKQKYLEVFGTDRPPFARFLVFDTAAPQARTLSDGRRVQLDPGEFLHLTVTNPAGFVQNNSEVRSWFPERNVPLAAIHAGAGQVRAVGRLSLFANAPRVYERVQTAFDAVNAIQPYTDLTPFDLYVNPNGVSPTLVFVVGSLSGGTGSGTFLDLAYLCRQHMSSVDTLAGCLLLPDVFVGRPATHNVQANAYGAIKELDHLMGRDRASINDTYRFGGHDVKMDRTPFDLVFLANNENKIGTVHQDVREMTELLGMAIYVSSGAVGKGTADVWDNMKGQIAGAGAVDGKRMHYASFGVSELFLNSADAAERHATGLARGLVESGFLGLDANGIGQAVDGFVVTEELCEHERDQVIDALYPANQVLGFKAKTPVTKRTIEAELPRRSQHLQTVETQVRAHLSQTLRALTNTKVQAIRDYIALLLGKPGGLRYSVAFLDELLERLKLYSKEMEQERDELTSRKTQYDARYGAIEAAINQVKGKLFGADAACAAQAQNLERLVTEEARALVESLRRNDAITFFATLIGDIKRQRDDLDALANRFAIVHRQISEQLERLRGQMRSSRPFTIELQPPDDTGSINGLNEAGDFLASLSTSGRTVSDLVRLSAEDLRDEVLAFARGRQHVAKIASAKIEDVLQSLPAGELDQLIKKLDARAAPLWKYDAAFLSLRHPEVVHVLGVDNEQETLLSSERLQRVLTGGDTKLVSTSDPHRVYYYKFEAAAPAFTIDGVQRYRSRYEQQRMHGAFHVHKDWEGVPDLFPNASEAVLRAWSLSNAAPFGLVKKKGAYYYAYSREQGRETDDFMVRLAQGREQAVKALEDNPKLVEELDRTIEDRASKLGSENLGTQLSQYLDWLRTQPVQNEALRDLIEEEIKTIRTYVNRMNSVA